MIGLATRSFFGFQENQTLNANRAETKIVQSKWEYNADKMSFL
jgi:hypothetical protein